MADMQRPAGSGPGRVLLPKPPASSVLSLPSDGLKKRKRETISVACERCRKRKTKCDGERPFCLACREAKVDCRYPTTGIASSIKDESRVANRDCRVVFDALRSMPAPEAMDLLKSIRSKANLDSTLDMLRARQSRQGPSPLLTMGDDPSTAATPHVLQYQYKSPSAKSPLDAYGLTPLKLPISAWTNVDCDDEVLTHMLTLFWTWDNSLARIIHRAMFVEDLCAGPDANRTAVDGFKIRFCSEFLVNSMLAISAIYSVEQGSSRMPLVSERVFAEEAFRLLEVEEKTPSLPLLQGIAMLAVYQHVFDDARAGEVLYEKLFRLHSGFEWAVAWTSTNSSEEKSRENNANAAVALIAFGFYNLDAKLSLVFDQFMTARKPLPSARRALSIGFEYGESEQDKPWFAYPIYSEPQLSYRKEVLDAECDFAELTEEALVQIEDNNSSPVPDFAAAKALTDRVFRSRHFLGEKVKGDHSQLPTRMFLTVSYHMLIIRIIEPFVRLSFLEFDGGQTASSLSLLSSDAIVSALWNYNTAFGMRHEYWLLQACQVAATAMVLQPHALALQRESFSRACQLLHDMGERLPRAYAVLSGLRCLITSEGVDVPDDARQFLAAGAIKAGRVTLSAIEAFGKDREELARAENARELSFTKDIDRIGELSP